MEKNELHKLSELMTLGDIFRAKGGGEVARRVLAMNGGPLDFHREMSAVLRQNSSFDQVVGINLDSKDLKGYSLGRAILADANRRLREDAPLEAEVSRHCARVGGSDSGNLHVPFAVLGAGGQPYARNFDIGSASEAGNLMGGPVETPIVDPLRAALTLAQLGAVISGGYSADFSVPRFASAPDVGYLSETGAASTMSQTTDEAVFTAKRVGGTLPVSRMALIQARGALDRVLERQIAQMTVRQIEDGAINGDGTGVNPLGIRSTSGINSVVGGSNGAQFAWSHALDLENAAALVDAEPGPNSGYLTNTKVRRWAKNTPRATYQPMIWTDGDRPLNGHRAATTSNVPSNLVKGSASTCSSVIYSSDWSMLMIALFGVPNILVDPVTYASTGRLRLVVQTYFASGVLMPGAFSVMDDALTA